MWMVFFPWQLGYVVMYVSSINDTGGPIVLYKGSALFIWVWLSGASFFYWNKLLYRNHYKLQLLKWLLTIPSNLKSFRMLGF